MDAPDDLWCGFSEMLLVLQRQPSEPGRPRTSESTSGVLGGPARPGLSRVQTHRAAGVGTGWSSLVS